MTVPAAPKNLSGTPMCFQTYHNRPHVQCSQASCPTAGDGMPSEHNNDGWTADIHHPWPTSDGYRIFLDVTQFDPESAQQCS